MSNEIANLLPKVVPIRDGRISDLYYNIINSDNPRCVYLRRDIQTLAFFSLYSCLPEKVIQHTASLNTLLELFIEKAKEFQDSMDNFMLIAGGTFKFIEGEPNPLEEGFAVLYRYNQHVTFLTLCRDDHWDVFNKFQTWVWNPAEQRFDFSTEDWLSIIPIYERSRE